jgi:hypothetical protein
MLPVIFAAVVVYFLNNETMSKKLDTSLVIIKEPESDTVKINSIPVKARTTTSHPRREEPKILKRPLLFRHVKQYDHQRKFKLLIVKCCLTNQSLKFPLATMFLIRTKWGVDIRITFYTSFLQSFIPIGQDKL